MNSLKFLILPAILAFSILILSTSALASISLNVSVTPVVQSNYSASLPNTNLTVYGSIVNTTTSDTIARINVTAVIGSNFNSQVTGSDGLFNYNVTAPTAVGEYTFNVTTNSSSLPNKTFTFYVSNVSTNTTTLTPIISFIGKFPPFTNGTTFTVNVTLFNEISPIASYQPRIKVFQANGQNVSWTVTNLSASTNATGSIAFNITVPANANPGEYGISVDGGRAFTIFSVGSSYQMAVSTLTSSDEVTSNFAPSSSVTILAKLRANSNPVTGATVTAVITYPNGTTTKNITLSAHPSSEGFYNNTFTDTSVQGVYKVKVGALKGADNIIGSTSFNTKTFEGRIEPVKEFFFEWGGKSAFKPGQTVGLNMVTVNLTGGSIITWSSCSALNYTLIGIRFANSTNSSLGNASVSYATDQYLPDVTVCRVSFAAPTTAGTYNIKVNVTLATASGTENQTIDGFFSVSNHFLKVTPVLDLGGFEGFTQVVSPGTNITIRLSAINVSGNAAVNPQNITQAVVTRILPMEFVSGATEVTNINQSSYNGVNGVIDPNITFTLPETIAGPLMIEVRAIVNSSANATSVVETVTGTAFLISNYLNGFMGPQKGGGLPTHEGEGSSDFNADALCSGTQTFSGIISDTNTSTAAQGAVVVGVIQAREEATGKDVSSFISLVNTSASSSTGAISASVTFSPSGGYSFSGNYFMIFNASYKGRYAGIPSFFMCRNLNIGFPQIKVIGSNQQFSWQVSPTSALNVTLTNVAHMNGSLVTNTSTFQSVFSLTQIFNFNPSTGTMQILKNITPMQTTFTNNSGGTANSAALTVYPQNYSLGGVTLTKWPNGFFDLRPRVVSNYGTDTGFGGFMVVAFDAFPEFSFGQSWAAGSTQSIVVRAATNVTNFTISMGRPWEGQLLNTTLVSITRLADGWNNTNNTGNFSTYADCQNPQSCAGPYERWNVTFTVPNTLRKGGTMLTVKVISNATGLVGESVEVPLFVTVSKFNVILPNEEMVGSSASTMDAYFVKSSAWPATGEPTDTTNYGWDLTGIANTYGINSTSGRVCIKNTFNSTRLSQGSQQNLGLNATANGTRIVVIDAVTSGVYSTVILNRSNAGVNNITIVNMSSRSMGGQLYLWEIKDCSFFTMVNVSTSALLGQQGFMTNTGGGSHAAGTNFTLPYVVISAGAPQNNVPVSIKSVAKQDNRGFGFEGKLTAGGTQFNASGTNTNIDGVAFVNVSIGPSGKMIAFWATTVGGESDSADFSSATYLEIKAISTSAQSFTSLTSGVVTLVNDSSNRTGLVGIAPNNWIFNGTVTETTDGDFVTNGVADTWNIIFNATSNRTRIVNATGATVVFSDAQQSFYNGSLDLSIYIPTGVTALQNTRLKIGEWSNGSSANTFSKAIVLYTDTSGQNTYTVVNATQNISSIVCAQGFERPTGKPFENATLNASVRDWSSFPPTTKYLAIYKFSNNSQVDDTTNPALTSPSGCIAVRIGPGQLGSWPSASGGKPPVFIEGTLTKGATSEFVYVGDVFRA